ncbi:hypothetical protein HRR83_004966 [Exophiala dermatitidis]|uniref:Uncharacterized protein n=1 Tax=Exophiala dermatitidis TaxID=5970 RepID=A0AAN6IV35_EXODE|nr:hypothetical protein HRR74_004869 [Exophiala dermatitidis]KAJ4519703.1 hypothetical protein HRR73_003763 [Exophiala dermatitidis]KAJ4534494.1 hypothetical protein HRR76_006419 [Exophiala dermatitidis]KAJ4551161.1 hypothetical protein HRR77_003504 [Exophiala dermatitidis]KAJ4561032.1 hypothetical protein HRR79_007593 [Exophiala dermatitidis]
MPFSQLDIQKTLWQALLTEACSCVPGIFRQQADERSKLFVTDAATGGIGRNPVMLQVEDERETCQGRPRFRRFHVEKDYESATQYPLVQKRLDLNVLASFRS